MHGRQRVPDWKRRLRRADDVYEHAGFADMRRLSQRVYGDGIDRVRRHRRVRNEQRWL